MSFDLQAFRKVADALHDYPECRAALARIEQLEVQLDAYKALCESKDCSFKLAKEAFEALKAERQWKLIDTARRVHKDVIELCVSGCLPAIGTWFDPSMETGWSGSFDQSPRWLPFDPEGVFLSQSEFENYLVLTSYKPSLWRPLSPVPDASHE